MYYTRFTRAAARAAGSAGGRRPRALSRAPAAAVDAVDPTPSVAFRARARARSPVGRRRRAVHGRMLPLNHSPLLPFVVVVGEFRQLEVEFLAVYRHVELVERILKHVVRVEYVHVAEHLSAARRCMTRGCLV